MNPQFVPAFAILLRLGKCFPLWCCKPQNPPIWAFCSWLLLIVSKRWYQNEFTRVRLWCLPAVSVSSRTHVDVTSGFLLYSELLQNPMWYVSDERAAFWVEQICSVSFELILVPLILFLGGCVLERGVIWMQFSHFTKRLVFQIVIAPATNSF